MARRVIVLLLAVLTSMGLAGTAAAQAAPTDKPDRVTFAVPLTAKGGDGERQAADVNCGTIFIQLADKGNGVAEFYYGYNVTLGTVFFHAIRVVWANTTIGRINNFTDNSLWLRTGYTNTRNESTGAGNVKAAMGVVVRLTNGITCVGATGEIGAPIS